MSPSMTDTTLATTAPGGGENGVARAEWVGTSGGTADGSAGATALLMGAPVAAVGRASSPHDVNEPRETQARTMATAVGVRPLRLVLLALSDRLRMGVYLLTVEPAS